MLPRQLLEHLWQALNGSKPYGAQAAAPVAAVTDIGELRLQARAHRLRTTVPLFSEIDAESLLEIVEQLQQEDFAPATSIIHQGAKADKFYVLLEGTAEVVREGFGGVEIPLAILQDGSFFGEMALLSRTSRTATVRTRTRCRTLSLSRRHFEQLIRRHGHIRQFLEVVADARAHENVHRQVYGWAVSSRHHLSGLESLGR